VNEHQRLPKLLTVEEFAEALPGSVNTVRWLIQKRAIETYRLGKRVYIPTEEIARLREAGRRPALR
jgi:excisionase family DNA binding protein